MNIEIADQQLHWGQLDLSLFGINKDYHGNPINPPIAFAFAIDHTNLWFVASHQKPATIHPDARPGLFQQELWKHDVAEFFILDPTTGHYLEFNLAPNGAWWAAEFTAPRTRAHAKDKIIPDVGTYADLAPDGSWMAAAAIPLKYLRKKFNFNKNSHLNAAFIINSPDQTFITAAPLGSGEPDFHQPQKFKQANFFHNKPQD